ncbi:hypothetical protein [Sporosarcina limicola]|uniref:Uncharacterized protein n=1 Tax=Sporosarcina limicola TaxID=34101 RepID=A0A927MNW3_9BACL|nr:hypothetical protein [Sporosarcina limicola]MBE1556317.1 hypothetical protein [Sporosarcina limicola]
MLNDLFYRMRDVKNSRKEVAVTGNRTGQPLHLLTERQCNVRIDTEGLEGDATLSIKFEESEDGLEFNEIGTFPIPDPHHGVLFAQFQPYVRYQLIVGGIEPNMNLTISF